MRTIITSLAVTAALATTPLAFAQINILDKEVVMINGTGNPALNGPLGNFVGNTNQSGNPPAQPDGTVGQLPPADFAKTPLITPALERARALARGEVFIQVEVETLEQLAEALDAGARMILLDNMDLHQMHQAVGLKIGRAHV